MNLLSALERAARLTPDKPFLRYAGRSVSYREARERSCRSAAVLHGLGVRPGDRVAMMCFNTPAFVDVLLGAWRLQAVVVPINHKLQAPEVDYMLAHSAAKVLLFDAALQPVAAHLRTRVARLVCDGDAEGAEAFEALRDGAPAMEGVLPDDDALAEILYTSGTTGRPKGCMHSHRSLTLAAMIAALALSMTRDERTLMAMPIWHSSPLNNWFGGTLYVGGTVVLLREYHPQHFLQAVQDERTTLFFGAPVSYTLPLDKVPDFERYDLSSARAWIYGGGPIGADVARRLGAAYRSERFFQVYGMTETGPAGTTLYPEEQVAKAGSIGRMSLPGVDMRVVRNDGSEAGRGDTGEVWLRGGGMMLGYLDDEAATRGSFAAGGWYRSGDIVRVDEDGYLFVVDRAKDMIITGGENVYSKEVEDVLSAHPELADVAVIGRPHPEWGETVVAHVVRREGSAVGAKAVQEFCADKLARYKIPREVVFSDSLPRTPTGKLQKFMLRTDA